MHSARTGKRAAHRGGTTRPTPRRGRHAQPRAPQRLCSPRHLLGLGTLTALALAGMSPAWAYWSANGTGQGAAGAGAALHLSIEADSTPTQLLYPAGPAVDVTLEVANPNPFPVSVTSLQPNGAITAGNATGCNLSSVTFTAPAEPTDQLPFIVPADGSHTITLPGAAQMGAEATDACQGASFTIPLLLSGTSTKASEPAP